MVAKCPSCLSKNVSVSHSDGVTWWQCVTCDCRWIYEVHAASHWSSPALASALTEPLDAGVITDAVEKFVRGA